VDNCEHVVDAAAELVDALATRTDGVTVLATSREPLNVDGEVLVRLAPLAVDGAAVELFVDRAAAIGSGFVAGDLATERSAVEAVCRSLDGLPLALELAAARLATMSLHELADGLAQRFDVLNRGRRTAEERHRSLRSVVEWSVRSLSPELRSVLARLSVFAGPFTLDAAAAVGDEVPAVMADHVADLVERSLLVAHPPVRGRARFGFLETIRHYAADLLAASGEAGSLRDRHADWVLGLFDLGEGSVAAPEVAWPELAELRVAHRHLMTIGDADRALRLACDLHYLALLGMQAEAFGWIIETATRFGDEDHPDAEEVLASAATGAWQSGDLDAAARWATLAEAAAARSPWPGAGAAAGEALGDVALFRGDHRRSLQHWEDAVARSREEPRPERLVTRLADLGLVASYVGEHERAAAAVAEARARLGGSSGWVSTWVDYAEGETLAEVDPPRAIRVLARAVAGAEATGAAFVSGVAGLTLTSLQIRTGDVAGAVDQLRRLIEHWRRSGAWVQQLITLRTVVEALVALGDVRTAALLVGAVEASADEAEATGPDAERLRTARAAIEAGLDRADAAERFEAGAAMGRDELVDIALEALGALSGMARWA
jgi:predicted ATPase